MTTPREPQEVYADSDASPPPAICEVCATEKSDGRVVTLSGVAAWCCQDCLNAIP